MADLMTSLSSEDENSEPSVASDDELDDELDDGFCFGDQLDGGKDKGSVWDSRISANGWSFESAVQLVERENESSLSSTAPRLDLASLIEAKVSEGNTQASGRGLVPPEKAERDTLKIRAGENEAEANSLSDDRDREEEAKAANYFEQTQVSPTDDVAVFAQLTLSRPILRGIASIGYVQPTPIQSAVIPVALAGRDVCASAVTGSGKTAAFLLPVLERLLYRGGSCTKALILTPTRELAAQCYAMVQTLAQHTKLQSTLVVGGSKNVKAQAVMLLRQPDVVVATPGRMLDHVTNSHGVSLEDLDFLVLDEADRLLDLGFQEEVHELIRSCRPERQTLLFSATMTTRVDDLIKLSLKRPVRISVSEKKTKGEIEVAPRLEQEFVRVRAGNEGVNREGMLLALLTRTFRSKTIVFCDTKSTAHRMMILCGLIGINCAELHGNLTQSQRLSALEEFRRGRVDVLLATDLAARGLDINNVEAVVNFEMPATIETYVHRIGRTARAGKCGKSCTLIGEGRRHLMKAVVRDAEDKAGSHRSQTSRQDGIIRSRTIPGSVVSFFVEKIKLLESDVRDILRAEAVARMDRLAEMEAAKAQNIIENSAEILAQPKRQWFASRVKRNRPEAAASNDKGGGGEHRMTRKKRRARDALAFHAAGVESTEFESTATMCSKRDAKLQKRSKEKRELGSQEISASSGRRKSSKAPRNTGESSLFADESIAWTGKPNGKGTDPLRYADQSRQRRKKKSVNAFKSKSKYKRRR